MKRRDFIRKTAGVSIAAGVSPYIMAGNSKMLTSTAASTQDGKLKRFGDGRDWFFDKRFGMFIHWGLYSIPGWHEQHQWRGRIERAEYVKLAEKWNPVKFEPERWLDLMEEVGMEYMCVTTKHHDGFCLWDTRHTSFNTMNTPYGKDIIGMLADACQKRNVPLSLYYSIADWNHQNYPNQGRAHQLPLQPQDSPDWDKYLDFLKGQVRELCTNYGKIHGFWWDINRTEYHDTSINEMIRQLQPEAVINNRGFDEGDFGTPERDFHSDDSIAFDRPTEACQSVGIESWGYRKDEDFYTDRHLFRSIDRYLARDANYLLNVGPMADGTIPAESTSILKRTGKWYHAVKESLIEVVPVSALTSNRNVMLTSRDNSLYVHLNKELPGNVVKLKPINTAPVRATLLNDGRTIDYIVRFSPSDHLEQKAYLNLINLPVEELCNTVMVIKLDFDKPLNELSRPESPEDGQSGWIYQ
jgi:alpha-L-fucosidase